MRVRTIAFVIICFAVLGYSLEGRPVRQWLDDTTEHSPARYGYEISRKDQDGQCHFTVKIAPFSVKALEKAELIWLTNRPAKVLLLPATDASGCKQLEFTIPQENLKGACLDLDSGPVKYCGPQNQDNFVGFRINLESASPLPLLDDVQIFARKKDGAFEFCVVWPQPTNAISGPGPFANIISASLSGSVEGGKMTVPFAIPSIGSIGFQNEQTLTLPAAALESFVLSVNYAHYDTPLRLTKTTTLHLALGIIAANAEAGCQAPLPAQLQMKWDQK